jgi:hypothetical protein
LKIKLKVCHFDTFEMIEAASQAVLNAHTEHDSHYAFKRKMAEVLEMVNMHRTGLL